MPHRDRGAGRGFRFSSSTVSATRFEVQHALHYHVVAMLRVSFKITILTLFTVLTAALSAAVLYLNYTRSSAAAMQAAESLLEQTADRVLLAMDRLLEPLLAQTNIAVLLPGADASGGGTADHPLTPLLATLLRRYPQMTAAYLGNGRGEFYRVAAFDSGREAMRASFQAPESAAIAVQSIVVRPGGRRTERWRFLDAAGKEIGSRLEPDVLYDPRTRPWYLQALHSPQAIVTDYYSFAVVPSVGLTVAKRVGDAPGTVFAADLTMSSVSRYLASVLSAQVSATHNAKIALFHLDGRLLAHSDAAAYERAIAVGGAPRVPGVGEVGAGVMEVVLARHRAVPQAQLRVTDRRGMEWLVHVARLAPAFGEGARLAIAIPVEDILGPLAHNARETLLVSLGMVLIFLPLVYLAAGAVSAPLARLTVEIAAIRGFDLTPTPPVRSLIAEIQDLASALAATKSMLGAFAKYVPKNLVRRIVRKGKEPKLGGERRPVTVFFSDVRDFTTISEQVPPERLMEFTSEYLEGMVNLILAEGGTVDKFVGDQIMAYWNAPTPDPRHAAHASRAVLRCRDWSNERNERWAREGQPVLYTRFALHLGDAVVGNVGSSDRMDYTVVGATVNLGSRIEGLNKIYGTQVLVTRPVAEAIGPAFVLRPVDRVLPKGAVHPLDVFELKGVRADDEAADLAVDAHVIALCEAWSDFYQQYLARDWLAAQAALGQFEDRFGEDALGRMYASRLKDFATNPPPGDWDGVIRYAEK